MSKRIIKKIAVLGSGVMGSRIACHFAGVGLQVLLLDIMPKDLAADAKPSEKNKIVNDALASAVKSNPSPVYTPDVLKKIRTGNFTDNMKDIVDCDWVIEVVVERLDIKQSVFTEVEKYRRPGTLITSNTSGIPIHMMTEGRSDDFKNIFVVRTFLIHQDICACWRSYQPHSPIRKLLTFSCTMATSPSAKKQYSAKTPLHLSPIASAFSV